jgi:phosphonate transport system permease protein
MQQAPSTPFSELLASDAARLHSQHRDKLRWQPRRLIVTLLAIAALAGLFTYAVIRLEIMPERLLKGLGALAHFLTLMMPPTAGSLEKFLVYLHALGETLAIAMLGTVIAAAIAFPLAFLAARNVLPLWPVRFLTRRFSDAMRGVDQLIWALIWVGVVGLGPMAGVLAIATSDIGTFIKLFSETLETADHRAQEGVASSGGGKLEVVRYGLLPQVLPVIAGQVLYLFESNVRSSTIIGIVGAGGIGLHLSEQIRTLEWQHVSLLIILILIAVAVTDTIAGRLRAAIAGRSGQSPISH